MKRVLFALMMVSMLVATIVIAQNRSSNGRGLQRANTATCIAEDLNLSATQEAQLAEICNNHQESMRTATAGLTGDQLQAKRLELCKQKDSKIEKILDKEQYDKFLELCQMSQNSSQRGSSYGDRCPLR